MKYVFLFCLVLTLCFSSCAIIDDNTAKNNKYKERQTEEKTQTAMPAESLISEAQTIFYDKTENRINNIKLAANSINGLHIAAYDTFSFNETVGDRTEEKGYKKAPIILYGEREYDYGGGVCQVSTTLYQAAKAGGLEIKERHSHKKEVDYAKEGEDSAVDYDLLDLKFVNNTDSEIVINTGVYEEFMVVQIYRLNNVK